MGLASHRVPAFLLILLFLVVSGGFAVGQHLTFHTRARDMGIYVQVLWNAAQGRPFASTLLEENTNHLAEHVAPSLWPLVPLLGLLEDAVPLIVIQQLFMAASGLPVYLLGRARLGSGPGLLVLLCFYLMPAISRVSLSEFHPVVLAMLPVVSGIACILAGWPRTAGLLLLLSLLFEEETGPTALAAGFFLAFTGSRSAARTRRVGLSIAAAAVTWTALAVLVVMPAFRLPPPPDEGSGLANRAFSHYERVVQDSGVLWSWLVSERGPDALAWLLLPNGGLALLSPAVLAINLPGFIILFLQDRASTYAGHWSAPLLPVVWLATSLGLARLRSRRNLFVGGLALMCAGTAMAYPLDSYFPGGREFEADHYQTNELERELALAASQVPPEASLVATRRVVPHLAARRDLYQFTFTFYDSPLRPDSQRQDYYILDLTDTPSRRAVEMAEADSVLEKRPRYNVQRLGPSVLLLSRHRPEPAIPRDDTFGGALRLTGVEWPDGAPEQWRSGDLSVRLFWEALNRPESGTFRQIRLLDRGASPAYEISGQPLDDHLPARDWERGQLIVEKILLPADRLGGAASYLTVSWRGANGRAYTVDRTGATELELGRFQSP